MRSDLWPRRPVSGNRKGPFSAPLVYREGALQPHLTVMQHSSIKPSMLECVRRTRKEPIELRTVESDEQQVHARVERLNDGRADVVLIDCAHHQIVGDDHAMVVPSLANDSANNTSGMRCRMIRIDRRQRDMPDHELCARTRQDIPERTPVGSLEVRQRRIKGGAKMMGIGTHAAQAGEMFHSRPYTEGVEATYISQTNIGDRVRIAGYCPLADERVEIKSAVA